jgi:type II secretory pathway pseudopilin PulG
MTLLETLVSLAVMAIIALMLAEGMSSMLRFSTRGSAHSEEVATMTARLQLRRMVEWAADTPFPGHAFEGFHGDDRSLTVETWYPEAPFWAGEPVVVQLSADETGAVHAVARGFDLHRKPLTLDQIIIAAGGFSLRYFGQRKGDQASGWHDRWQAEDGLPRLMEIAPIQPSSDVPPLILRPARQIRIGEMDLSNLQPMALP